MLFSTTDAAPPRVIPAKAGTQFYRLVLLASVLFLSLLLVFFQESEANPADGIEGQQVTTQGRADTILAPEGGFYDWSVRDSLIAVVLVEDTILVTDYSGNVRCKLPVETEPGDISRILPGDSLLVHAQNKLLSARPWHREIAPDWLANLAGWKTDFSMRRLQTNEVTFRHKFWGLLVDFDYSPERGLLALISCHSGADILEVVDVASETLLYRELLDDRAQYVLFDSAGFYVTHIWKWSKVLEYTIDASGEVAKGQTYSRLIEPPTCDTYFEGGRKRAVVYSEWHDDEIGPIQFRKDSSMCGLIRAIRLPLLNLGPFVSYDASREQMYLSWEDRIIVADFKDRKMVTYNTGDWLNCGEMSYTVFAGDNRFLSSLGWHYGTGKVICLLDITHCPITETKEP
ncbi:MAG: hypothetical protein GY835_10140 [bacterium]|nr:hypothetical protein [bacterium]